VLAPVTETVTADAAVVVVYAYTVAVVEAGVTVIDDDPADALTVEPIAETRRVPAPTAVNVTGVPATTVAVIRSASLFVTVEVSATLTTLSDGTLTVNGEAAVPAPEISVVTSTETVLALAGVITSVLIVMAATTARAIFLNEFIFLLLLFIWFILFLVYPNSL
jgi:hypothetical protein